MRHGVDGRKFGRNTSHRVAMLKNLANNLIREEQIITTIQKAKETRRVAERLITLAKRDTLNTRRLAFARTRDKVVVAKLFDELITRYKGRSGGYTRIVKVSETRWDHPKLDKKKKTKVASENVDPSEQAPTDPFNKFRKLFGQKKSVKAEAGEAKAAAAKVAKAPKAEKAATEKKAPAAKKTAAKKAEK
jgi:large subunit ribosomal protein L17